VGDGVADAVADAVGATSAPTLWVEIAATAVPMAILVTATPRHSPLRSKSAVRLAELGDEQLDPSTGPRPGLVSGCNRRSGRR
jgi:hypothetical protein